MDSQNLNQKIVSCLSCGAETPYQSESEQLTAAQAQIAALEGERRMLTSIFRSLISQQEKSLDYLREALAALEGEEKQ